MCETGALLAILSFSPMCNAMWHTRNHLHAACYLCIDTQLIGILILLDTEKFILFKQNKSHFFHNSWLNILPLYFRFHECKSVSNEQPEFYWQTLITVVLFTYNPPISHGKWASEFYFIYQVISSNTKWVVAWCVWVNSAYLT